MKDKREIGKEEIIQAAMTVFDKHGFHETKMKDIATEAGIGKGTLYEYFESKKELFRQMIIYKLNSYIEGIEKVIAHEGTTREKLMGFAAYHGGFMHEHHSKAEMIFLKSDSLPEEFKQWMVAGRNQIFRLMLSLIEEGMNRGELRKDLNKEIATAVIFGGIKEYYLDKIYCVGTKPGLAHDIENRLQSDY
ncbi:transcriptional regulator, TetR family [Alkaliphilus metalliredigens QYMF]|uniref:Transcriptional regulator, TetR family n=1 Tax=Alkaliphilus metalliredigens (strain QYMF) TaxID=293826 RepID=A6TK26_ALKMQ|nr:TetR/AcrR family transcriptional regulator [Alkaliphilus metalliredigens]ABR46544.1 transcriptional regulator, TetR family [Alkaliphilus metalliredigens QYMF]